MRGCGLRCDRRECRPPEALGVDFDRDLVGPDSERRRGLFHVADGQDATGSALRLEDIMPGAAVSRPEPPAPGPHRVRIS